MENKNKRGGEISSKDKDKEEEEEEEEDYVFVPKSPPSKWQKGLGNVENADDKEEEEEEIHDDDDDDDMSKKNKSKSRRRHVCIVVFDLDGTLVESIKTIQKAVNMTLKKHDRSAKLLNEKEVREFIGEGAGMLLGRAFHRSLGLEKLPEGIYDVFLDIYEKLGATDSFLYEGVLDTLTRLNDEKEIIMAVATNKPQVVADIVIDELGLRKFFGRCVIGGDTPEKKKPHRMHLDLAVETALADYAHPVETHTVIMIGDAEPDIACAKHAKALSIGCSWGYMKPGIPLSSLNPDEIVDSFIDVFDSVKRLMQKAL